MNEDIHLYCGRPAFNSERGREALIASFWWEIRGIVETHSQVCLPRSVYRVWLERVEFVQEARR